MGYSIDRVLRVDEVDENLFCVICLDPLADARVTCRQGHAACFTCLHARRGLICPTCYAPLPRSHPEELERHVKLQRESDEIPARCGANEMCEWRGPLKDAAAHEESCGLRLVDCAFVSGGCEERLPVCQVDEHASLCTYRPVFCPHRTCTTAVIARELDIHLRTCPADECANDGCTFHGTCDAVLAHRRHCDPMARRIELLQRDAVNASLACQARTLHIQQLETSVHVRQGRIERQDRRIVELEGVAEAQRALVDQAEARGRQLDDAVAASNAVMAQQCERINALEAELQAMRRLLDQERSAALKRKSDDGGDIGRDRKMLKLQQPTPPHEIQAPLMSPTGPVIEAPTAWPRRNLVPGGRSLAHFLTSGGGLNLQNL